MTITRKPIVDYRSLPHRARESRRVAMTQPGTKDTHRRGGKPDFSAEIESKTRGGHVCNVTKVCFACVATQRRCVKVSLGLLLGRSNSRFCRRFCGPARAGGRLRGPLGD